MKVALTPEGEKWVYTPPTVAKKQAGCDDPDMKNSYLNESYPDETITTSEEVVSINPTSHIETYDKAKKAVEKKKTQSIAEMTTKELSVYEMAQMHAFTENVIVYCQKRNIYKIRNIKLDSLKAKNECAIDANTAVQECKYKEATEDEKVTISITLPNDTNPYVISIDPKTSNVANTTNGTSKTNTTDKKAEKKKDAPTYIASAEVIVENAIVTPFGRVYKNLVKGDKTLYVYHFIYDSKEKVWNLDSTNPIETVGSNANCSVDDLLNIYENAYKEHRKLLEAKNPNEASIKKSEEKIISIEKKLQFLQSRFSDEQKTRKTDIEEGRETEPSSCSEQTLANNDHYGDFQPLDETVLESAIADSTESLLNEITESIE